MTFSYVADTNISPGNANRLTSAPTTTQLFHWWYLATPAPAYVCTTVRVTSITDSSHISVVFYDPYAGTEIAHSEKAIDLDDQTYCWRGLPSQLDHPTGTALAVNNSGLLFFTDAWLSANQPTLYNVITSTHPELYHKYPYAEDGGTKMLETIKELVKQLEQAGLQPLTDKTKFPKLGALTDSLKKRNLPGIL